MGLDLVVEGCPKPGHEDEWRRLLKRSFAEEELSEAEKTRFDEISIPGYERLGAPRVGQDSAANQWILEANKAKTPEEVAAVLKEYDGYYVVRLIKCDGVPTYSNSGAYEGVDDTSFRGAFLRECREVLSKAVLNDAWNHKFPEEAIAYGKSLLAAADAAEAAGGIPQPRRSLFTRLGIIKESEPIPLTEQLEIVRAAAAGSSSGANAATPFVHGFERRQKTV